MKKLVKHPRREHWLVRQALDKLRVNYREQVPFFNPIYTGLRRRVDGGIQWLEFLIYTNGRMFAIIFLPTYSGSRPHKFELRAQDEKKDFLRQRGIPYIILPRTYSQQEYEIRIELWLRKEKKQCTAISDTLSKT